MFKTYIELIFKYQKSRVYFPILITLMLLNVLFESISIAAFYPFLTSMLGGDSIFLDRFPSIFLFINSVPNIFFPELDKSKTFIIGSLIVVISIFIIKFLFFLFFNFFLYFFVFDLNKSFSNKLFEKYLTHDYYSILSKGSAELQKDFLALIDYAVTAILAIINLIVEFLILIFIVLILLNLNFKFTALVFLSMCFISFCIFMVFKNKYYTWGKNRETLVSKKINTILESFNAIKELKIFFLEKISLKNFQKVNEDTENLNRSLNLVQVIPRGILELIAVLIIAFSLIFLTANFHLEVLNEYIALIGLSVLALVRLLPSFNKIIVSFQQAKVNLPSSRVLLNIFNTKNEKLKIEKDISYEKEIIFNNINFYYTSKKILDDMNLTIKKNSCIGIKGESGSGKSTFLNILLGLLKPSNGSIKIDDKNVDLNNQNWWKKIGFVHQESYIFNENIVKNIVIDDKNINSVKLDKILNDCRLLKLIENFETQGLNNLGERGSKVSGGEKQRIFIARALYKDPEILILDEPTSSLDTENEQKIIETLFMYKNKITIVIVSHTEKILQICDKVFELKDGKIN